MKLALGGSQGIPKPEEVLKEALAWGVRGLGLEGIIPGCLGGSAGLRVQGLEISLIAPFLRIRAALFKAWERGSKPK